jgi:transcriptional activator SPT7
MSRTPHSMTHYQSLSLQDPSPSFSDKGKAKDVLYAHQAPSWFTAPIPIPMDTSVPVAADDHKLEGQWWGFVAKDEAYTSGLPIIPSMIPPTGTRSKVLGRSRKRRKITPTSDSANNHGTCFTDSSATLVDEPLSMILPKAPSQTTPTSTRVLHSKPVNLTTKIHRNVDTLFNIRKTVNQIQDWQKAENEGLPLPIPRPHLEKEERRQELELRNERKRRRAVEKVETKKRIKMGGEVGEEEAALSVRAATGSMLAQAGFDGMSPLSVGANE